MSKEDVINQINELLQWKLSQYTETSLERLTYEELTRLFKEVMLGVQVHEQPLLARIDQLKEKASVPRRNSNSAQISDPKVGK